MTTGRCGRNMQQSGDSIDLRGLTWVPPCCAGHQSCRPWMRCGPAHSGRACCCCPPCCPDCPLMEHFPCLQHSRINAHLPSTWHLPFANSLAVQVCTVLVCVAARRSLILISMCTSCAWELILQQQQVIIGLQIFLVHHLLQASCKRQTLWS